LTSSIINLIVGMINCCQDLIFTCYFGFGILLWQRVAWFSLSWCWVWLGDYWIYSCSLSI